ncbi:MAG: glycoside hydrolase family 3 N-terminal domain-containing protein [Bacteroidota bacterium]
MTATERLRRKAAGLLVVRLGSNMQPPRRAEEDAAHVEALLGRYPLGGVILFNGAWPQTRETLVGLQHAALQGDSARPLLVMTDMERGLGQQVAGATTFPHARAFAALGESEAMTERFARASAREALACGVHVTFAPVADVNRNPDNPVISIRAFSEVPALAASLAAAYVRGCQAEGLLSTAKHFPGHGSTAEDSHAVLPSVPDARAVLDKTDLVPFRAALDAGCELVMTAHVAYPALDPSGRPATLSAPILQGLLRGEMGFEGVVISDSLHMGGIQADGRTEADLAVEQVRAGVDLLLDARDPAAIIEALAAAVEAGALGQERLDEALARADRLRARLTDRFGDDVFTDPGQAAAPDAVGAAEHRRLAMRVARGAVTVEGETVHWETGAGLLAVLVRPHASPLDPPEQPLGDALRERLPGVRYAEVGPGTSPEQLATLGEEAKAAERVLVALVAKPAAWHAFGLRPEQHAFVEALLRVRPVVVAALGSARVLDAFADAPTRLCAYSDAPAAQRALAEALAGKRAD